MDRSTDRKPGLLSSIALAAIATMCTVGLQSLSMQRVRHLDTETISTIAIVNATAAVVSALIAASLLRNRPLVMVVVSQVIAISMVAFVARM
jgi:hypothetical protein